MRIEVDQCGQQRWVQDELANDPDPDEDERAQLSNAASTLESIVVEHIQAEIASSQEDVYTVERVCDKKTVNGKVHYLLKWEGYSEAHNSWEPLCNIQDRSLVDDFNRERRQHRVAPVQAQPLPNASESTPATEPEHIQAETASDPTTHTTPLAPSSSTPPSMIEIQGRGQVHKDRYIAECNATLAASLSADRLARCGRRQKAQRN